MEGPECSGWGHKVVAPNDNGVRHAMHHLRFGKGSLVFHDDRV